MGDRGKEGPNSDSLSAEKNRRNSVIKGFAVNIFIFSLAEKKS
jgi:hypothetical protein